MEAVTAAERLSALDRYEVALKKQYPDRMLEAYAHILEKEAAAVSERKHPVYCCRTNHVSDAFACPSERVPEADILEAVLDGLHVQAMTAVEMARIWEERHRREKLDTAALQKNIAALREAHGRLERQIEDLYTSFGLREISKAECLASKAAAIQQRDSTAERLAALEANLENTSEDGELQNQFVARFRPHVEAEIAEITLEILIGYFE